MYNFTVIIERDEDGTYVVSVPALPGCHTESRTFEEARAMAIDAIQGYCESLLAHGETVPQESLAEAFIGSLPVSLKVAA